MDKNADSEQQVTTVKRPWHAPELRKNAVQDTTGQGTPYEFECES